MLCFVSIGFAQVTPFRVNVNKQHNLPEVFPLAENFFVFDTHLEIDTVTVSDTAHWGIAKNKEGHYVLDCASCLRHEPIDFDSTLHIEVHFKNKESVVLTAPIRVYADVKVIPYGPTISYDTIYTTLPCERVGFWAQWVYPEYVKKRWRLYGVFEVDILFKDDRIDGVSGWYDSGDRTKTRDFSTYPEEIEVNLRVLPNKLRTLRRFRQNGVQVAVRLSEDYPNEWRVDCREK